jgi:hypothetical protein
MIYLHLDLLARRRTYLPTIAACDLRILVYEYVDNGNLEQWLHGDLGSVSPLTWDIRMNIVLGTAKGCLNFPLFLFIQN